MKFHKPKDKEFKKFLRYLNPDDFLKRMLQTSELDEITENYGEDVYSLCNNAVAYMIIQLQINSPYYLYEVKIMKGTFQGKDHSWIRVGDYFIDLTLAQFIKCPRLAVTKIDEAEGYEVYSMQTHEDFIKELKLST